MSSKLRIGKLYLEVLEAMEESDLLVEVSETYASCLTYLTVGEARKLRDWLTANCCLLEKKNGSSE